MIQFLEVLLYLVALLNIFLAGWGVVEWYQAYKYNHTKYRILYILWIFISIIFCTLYVGAIFSLPLGSILSGQTPLYMILIRPAITLVLAASSVTAEVMRNLRMRRVKNDF